MRIQDVTYDTAILSPTIAEFESAGRSSISVSCPFIVVLPIIHQVGQLQTAPADLFDTTQGADDTFQERFIVADMSDEKIHFLDVASSLPGTPVLSALSLF
jgi:hypothetical protein